MHFTECESPTNFRGKSVGYSASIVEYKESNVEGTPTRFFKYFVFASLTATSIPDSFSCALSFSLFANTGELEGGVVFSWSVLSFNKTVPSLGAVTGDGVLTISVFRTSISALTGVEVEVAAGVEVEVAAILVSPTMYFTSYPPGFVPHPIEVFSFFKYVTVPNNVSPGKAPLGIWSCVGSLK